MTPEAKKKLSDTLKKKWASGTRKPNPTEYGKKISAALKVAHAEGRMHVATYETSMKGLAARDMDKVRAAAKRVAAMNVGVPMPPGPGAKGPNHWKAKYWIFKAPNQQIIQGWNLNELVRENAHLFDKRDVVWYGKSKCKCRATKGLRGLFEMWKDCTGVKIRKNHFWKGWTIGDRLTETPNEKLTGSPALSASPSGLLG